MMVALRPLRSIHALVVTVALLTALPYAEAFAQAIAAVVNGDPITTTEIDEQMKFRRLTKQGAGRNEALEDLIGDRLKLREANRYGVDADDSTFSQALNQIATKAKMSSSELLGSFQRERLNIDLVRSHVRALAAWNIFVRARYKALDVSQSDIDTAMATDSGLTKADTDYTLQQIVFVVPVGATPAVLEQRHSAALALRGRFTDCASGVPLARALPDVAVKPPVSKSETSLSDATRKALSQVEKGRLTTPERIPAGFEMVAVCNKTDDTDRSSVRDTVKARLLVDRLSKEADKLYSDLRAKAVVERR